MPSINGMRQYDMYPRLHQQRTLNLFGNPSSVNSDPTINCSLTAVVNGPHNFLSCTTTPSPPSCLRLAYSNTNASLTNSFQRGRNPVRSQLSKPGHPLEGVDLPGLRKK